MGRNRRCDAGHPWSRDAGSPPLSVWARTSCSSAALIPVHWPVLHRTHVEGPVRRWPAGHRESSSGPAPEAGQRSGLLSPHNRAPPCTWAAQVRVWDSQSATCRCPTADAPRGRHCAHSRGGKGRKAACVCADSDLAAFSQGWNPLCGVIGGGPRDRPLPCPQRRNSVC